MADEQAYVGKLVTPEEAHDHLAYDPFLQQVVAVALERWRETERYLASRQDEARQTHMPQAGSSTSIATGSASTSPTAGTPQGRFSNWFRRRSSLTG